LGDALLEPLESHLEGFSLRGLFRGDRRQELAGFVFENNQITGPGSPFEKREGVLVHAHTLTKRH
jgi:hypothetical protein